MEKETSIGAKAKAPARKNLLKRLFLPWSHTLLTVAIVFCVAFIVVLSIEDCVNAMNQWSLWALVPLAIVFTILLIFVVYIGLMALYVLMKRRNPHFKYLTEVLLIIVGFLLSVGFKFFARELPQTMEDVLQRLGQSLYGALGGLQFEGLASDWDVGGCISVTLYYGSSVLAGLLFFSVIASQAFYEIYCRVLINFIDTSDKDIYIFTALNEETLNIANSIADKKDAERESLIIFAGPSLKPFDRHDPNCVEVMGRRYLYWSFHTKKNPIKAKESPSTMLSSIGLTSWMRRPTNWNEVHIFAFDSDDDHIPNEEENMDYVFMDARAQMARMSHHKGVKARVEFCKKYYNGSVSQAELDAFEHPYRALAKVTGEKRRKKEIAIDRGYGVPKQHISYYILTKRRINYQAYQDKIDELNQEFSELFRQVNLDCFKQYNAWSEAYEKFKELEGKRDERYEYFRRHEFEKLSKAIADFHDAAKKEANAWKEFNKTWRESKPFSIYVWNESDAIAREAQLFITENDDATVIPDSHDIWVRSYGFGPTGQSLMRMLFTYSSALNPKDGSSTPFFCEVFDPEGKNALAGLTQMEMPFSVVMVEGTGKPSDQANSMRSEYERRRAKLLAESYRPYLEYGSDVQGAVDHQTIWEAATDYVPNLFTRTDRPYTNDELRAEVDRRRQMMLDASSSANKEIPIPLVYFHDYGVGDCRSAKSSGGLEGEEFHSPFNTNKKNPDYILVAVGDDYQNIRIANDLVRSLTQSDDVGHLVTVFVNVWDEKNNNLISGFSKARIFKKSVKRYQSELSADAGQIIYFSRKRNVRIVIVGNNADIYQRAAIVPSNRSINYNDAYDSLSGSTVKGFNDDYSFQSNVYFNEMDRYWDKTLSDRPQMHPFVARSSKLWAEAKSRSKNLDHRLSEGVIHLSLDAWRGLPIWNRRSSLEAQLFGTRYYQELAAWEANGNETIDSFIAGLARLEHQRWMRSHIADGWRWCPKAKNPETQGHPSILSYSLMRWETGIYDLMNVYLGFAIGGLNVLDRSESERVLRKLEDAFVNN